MKQGFTSIITILIFVFCVGQTMAQRANGLAVEGLVTVQEGSSEGAIIQMYRDGRRLDNYGIGADGRYNVELNWNHKWELVFENEGNFSQKIVIETAVPRDVLNADPKFPPFPVNINLFTEIPGIDNSFAENTVLKIFYSPSVDNFVKELYYNDAQIERLINQAIAQAQQIDENADFMARLTRAELAELRKEYNELLEQAGQEYSNEEFLEALDGYKAASKIFPGEQFPKDRIAEINDLLGLIMAAEELDAAMLARFNKLVREGDLHLANRQLPEAKKSYNRALSIKPFDQYVNDQLKKLAEMQEQQRLAGNYQNLIEQGDQAIDELLFNEALGLFNQALEIRPNEQYPKTKIAEINGLLAEQLKNQEDQKSYDDAMSEGERMFSKQFFDRALTSFENALSYKPGDIKATRRIEDSRKEMKRILDRMEFDKFIAAADKAYKKEDYPEALSNYEQALELVPDEPRTKKRVEEISEILYALNSFNEFVSQADKQFDAQSYATAKSLYEKANELKAGDKHVQERIAEIAQLIAQQGVDEQYAQVIEQADNMLALKNYEDARSKYTEALQIKPREQYPKDKLDEIASTLADVARLDRQYKDLIAEGDRLFGREEYTDAKSTFAEAAQLKPEETYPPEMMDKIDGLIAEQQRLAQAAAEAEAARLAAIQAEKDKNYNDAIARADELFTAENYEQSRNEYRAALDIKPEETYAQQRIDEIGNVLSQLSAAQKAYEDAVAEADREFRGESWEAAIAAYNTAKQAKADETYPDEQLAKIDSIVSTRERIAKEEAEAEAARLAAIQAEKDKNYNDAIARADELFTARNYEESRNEYRAALDVKPEEAYAQQRIDEIGNVLAQLSAAQKAYEDAVTEADREFRNESWEAAIAAYNTAKQAKANETYPDEQLAKIDSIVTTRERIAREEAEAEAARLAAIQAEKDKNYNDAIARADELFAAENYEESRNEYRAAQDIKPEELYPPQRIDEIDRILRELAAAQAAKEELDRKYANLIMQADRFFSANSFTPSKQNYTEALALKPEETYPKDKIAEIDRILEQRAIDEKYRNVIVVADGHFRTQSYDDARLQYEIALGVKPDEEYPKEQIRKIDAIRENERQQIAQEQANAEDLSRRRDQIAALEEELDEQRILEESGLNALYDQIIKKADGSFDIELYNVSRAWYYKAQDLKPEETYPPRRIAEINRILGEMMMSERDREYQRFIDLADESFRNNELAVARGWYNQALSQKDSENYPKEQLREIERRVAERVAGQSQQQFENFKTTATSAFEAGNYNVARFYYRKALELRSDDAEVKAKLQEIESMQ